MDLTSWHTYASVIKPNHLLRLTQEVILVTHNNPLLLLGTLQDIRVKLKNKDSLKLLGAE